MRYLLIDRILEFERDRRVVALKNVTLESDVMEHHLRGFPLFPGALVLESMAQTAAYLVMRSAHEATGAVVAAALGAVEHAHFRRPALPGDQLRITAELLARKPHAAEVRTEAVVGGQSTARAKLLMVLRQIEVGVEADLVQFMSETFRALERRGSLL